MDSPRAAIGALLARQAEAIRAKDIDVLMSLYSADVLYFDVVPPLRFAGPSSLRERFSRWFAGFEGPIALETRDLNISASEEMAFAHFLSKTSGTLKNGREIGSWVRATSCCRRGSEGWLITHEHISLPVDPVSGNAAMDLAP
jgi:ketosteroid isomerase-like protein